MTKLIDELARNATGYFLALLGVTVTWVGAHYQIPKLGDAGGMLLSAALLALQAKPISQGNAPAPTSAEADPSPKS